jgi:hypothetical protein
MFQKHHFRTKVPKTLTEAKQIFNYFRTELPKTPFWKLHYEIKNFLKKLPFPIVTSEMMFLGAFWYFRILQSK